MEQLEANIKKYITSLLTSTPLLVTMQQLSKDYRNTIGEPIQYQKLGYNSLEHFLRSINDTVIVKGSGPMAQVIPVYSEKSAHVNSLVQNQKINVTKKRQPHSRRRTYNLPRTININSQQTQPVRKIVYPSVEKYLSSTSKSSNQSLSSLDYHTYPTESQGNTKTINSLPTSTPRSTSERTSPSFSTPFNNPETCDNKKVESKLTTNKLRQDNVQKLLEKPQKNVINRKCSSVKNLIKNIGPDKNKGLTVAESKIPYYIRNNLRSLIGQHPNGLWCAEVPEKYRKMYQHEINYQELGYGTLISLCTDLSSIFHYVRPSNGDFKLYDKSRPLPDCAEKKFTIASYSVNNKGTFGTDAAALPQIDWDDANTYLPEDIFKPGEEIPRAFVPTGLQVNDTIDVVVGEVYDLSKFWVYLQDSMLDQLMDDLQDFYREHAAEYEIPSYLLREGLYCVQVIYGEYHRALIVDTMREVEDTIRVIFIDYGTMSKVSSIGVCFLHTQFSELPAQAIRCRLANLVPLEEGIPWSREASKAFRELVTDRDTSAKISSINWEDQFLVVFLADVTDPNDVFYLNDKLVEEGYATYAEKERSRPIVDSVYTPIVKLIHLFPTFVELEHGLAPSTAEMEVFHDLDVPINFCYPQYFRTDYSFEQDIIQIAEETHESNIARAKRRVPTRFYDIEKLRESPLDYSVFGDLAEEIKKFNESCPEDSTHNSDEDFIDAEEEFLSMDQMHCEEMDALTRQIRELSTKEEETVKVLKNDIRMTEDIMKDINLICNIGKVVHEKPELEVNLVNDEDNQNERELWTIDEARESFDASNCTTVHNESFRHSEEDENEAFFSHPLSNMSFDKDSLTEELTSPALDNDLDGFHNDVESLPTGEDFISHIMELVQDCSGNVPIEEQLSEVSTNPFLSDLSDSQDMSLKNLRLNSNNPFLSQPRSDASSSTTYSSTFTDMKVTHSWSQFTDISAETISELGRSLSSKSSSSSLIAVEDRHNISISTQTSDEKPPVPAPVKNCPSYPPYYPQPMTFGYAQWSMGYGNPYYRQMGYYEPPSAPFRPPMQPRVPPPPGFTPLNHTNMPGFCRGGGYVPRPEFYRAGAFPMGRFMPPMAGGAPVPPMPAPPVPPMPATAPVPPRMASVNLANSGGGDFYEAYNSKLLQRQERNAN